jgi:mRNA interferase HigB
MLEEWFSKASQLKVNSFPALRQTFGAADYVDGFTLFDVGGNRYRIAAVIHYDKQRLYIRQVMTHAEYDRNEWRKK